MKYALNSIIGLALIVVLSSCKEDEPTGNFSVENIKPLSGETVQFKASDKAAGNAYSWTFEGGIPSTSNEQNPSVLYKETGNFTATLEVVNDVGMGSSDQDIPVTCEGTNCDDLYVTRNHNYGLNVTQHMANIYAPKTDGTKTLVILYGGGGGTNGSNLDYLNELAVQLANRGYVVAAARYREASDFFNFTFDGPMDSKAAVRHFRANAEEWNIDPENIYIGGYSSGATMALIHAYMQDDEIPEQFRNIVNGKGGWEGIQGTPGVSSEIAGVISLSGALYDNIGFIKSGEPSLFVSHSETDLVVPCGITSTGNVARHGGCSILERAEEVGLTTGSYLFESGEHNIVVEQPAQYINVLDAFLNK